MESNTSPTKPFGRQYSIWLVSFISWGKHWKADLCLYHHNSPTAPGLAISDGKPLKHSRARKRKSLSQKIITNVKISLGSCKLSKPQCPPSVKWGCSPQLWQPLDRSVVDDLMRPFHLWGQDLISRATPRWHLTLQMAVNNLHKMPRLENKCYF